MGLSIPFFVRTWVVIAIFVVALLGLHGYWVWWKPLDKIGWKKVDCTPNQRRSALCQLNPDQPSHL